MDRDLHVQTGKRAEERYQVAGELTLRLPNSQTVQGGLMDVSLHGFKIHHSCVDLIPGLEVQVLYSWGKVWAKVVWTRQFGSRYESGFATG